ncbi:vitamin B12 dependent-methionine synthase activation domain-containing protein, partial [Vibrio lentus]
TLEKARENKVAIDWESYTPPQPKQLEPVVVKDMSVSVLRDYIDWTPFFMTWSLMGKYPAILKHEEVGEEAKRLYKDANDLLDMIEADGIIKANGMCQMFPANS